MWWWPTVASGNGWLLFLAAQRLAEVGHRVTVSLPAATVASAIEAASVPPLLRMLRHHRVRLQPLSAVVRVDRAGVVLRRLDTEEEWTVADAMLVEERGRRVACEEQAWLVASREFGFDLRVIGDALAPRRIAPAIHEGRNAVLPRRWRLSRWVGSSMSDGAECSGAARPDGSSNSPPSAGDGAGGLSCADRHEIADLFARYARAVDRSDWAALRTVYHPDAFLEHGYLPRRRRGIRLLCGEPSIGNRLHRALLGQHGPGAARAEPHRCRGVRMGDPDLRQLRRPWSEPDSPAPVTDRRSGTWISSSGVAAGGRSPRITSSSGRSKSKTCGPPRGPGRCWRSAPASTIRCIG